MKTQGRGPNGRFARNGVAPGKQHRWKKGESGNPRGRRSTKLMTEMLRAALAKGDVTEKIIDKLVKLALNGERWAVEMIFDRIDGKPVVRVDIRSRLVKQAEEAGIDPKEAVTIAEGIIKERGW